MRIELLIDLHYILEDPSHFGLQGLLGVTSTVMTSGGASIRGILVCDNARSDHQLAILGHEVINI